jgi:integrase/recombinase XerD
VNFGKAIDAFVRDMRMEGRINSDGTERLYRTALYLHADDCDDADPRETDREDVKETLARWDQPNTVKGRLAALVSFYDWLMQEGHRTDNPARQVRRPKTRKANVYRLTRDEAAGMLAAARGEYEQRIVTLGICAGLRNAELRGLTGRHFARPGFVHVSPDIGKGGRERWVPVILEALAVVEAIRATVAEPEFVLPRQVPVGGAVQVERAGGQAFKQDRLRPCSQQHIGRVVARVAERAGIRAHIYPHLMRHAYADHVSRHAGVKVAQHVLGHENISTTQLYLDRMTPDELAEAVGGMEFAAAGPGPGGLHASETRPAGFEPAALGPAPFTSAAEVLLDGWRLAGQVLLYERYLPAVSGRACPPGRPGVFPLRDQT